MLRSKFTVTTICASFFLTLGTAHAEEKKDAEIKQTSVTPQITYIDNEEVRGAVERNDRQRVTDNDGNVFINHFVPYEDLTEIDQNVEVIDTITFEHEGRVYTNRIVRE